MKNSGQTLVEKNKSNLARKISIDPSDPALKSRTDQPDLRGYQIIIEKALMQTSLNKKAEALHGTETQIKNIMSDLSVEKIIEIHDDIILKFGGAKGILSESTLHFMVYRINRIKDIFRRAATILHAIGSQHPFIDGNKRTALVVAENVLGQQGYYISADEDTIVEFMLEVASYKNDPCEIERWLKEHVTTMEN